MTIRKKVILSFSAICASFVLLGSFTLKATSTNSEKVRKFIGADIPLLELPRLAHIEVLNHRRYEKAYFLNVGNEKGLKDYMEKYENSSKKLQMILDTLTFLCNTRQNGELSKSLAQAKAHYAEYLKGFQAVAFQIGQNRISTSPAADAAMEPYKNAIRTFENDAESMVMQANQMRNSIEKNILMDEKSLFKLLCSCSFAEWGFLP